MVDDQVSRYNNKDNEPFEAVWELCGPVAYSKDSVDYYVDELEALNSILCYLCRVNADASVVERFLRLHPGALLLEGASFHPDQNARHILEHNMGTGQSEAASTNCMQILEFLNLGFGYFQGHRLRRSAVEEQVWSLHFEKLVNFELEFRKLRRDELDMRIRVQEAAVEVQTFKRELDHARVMDDILTSRQSQQSPLALLGGCNRRHHRHSSSNRLPTLEYQVAFATLNLGSIKLEHSGLLQRIAGYRQAQFAAAESAFKGCERHEICVVGSFPHT